MMKIVNNRLTIIAALEAIESNLHAAGVMEKCEFSYNLDGEEKESFFEIKPKSGSELSAEDYFEFGRIVGQFEREYEYTNARGDFRIV